MSNAIHDGLSTMLQGQKQGQLMSKPRGEFQKYTVYAEGKVIGTVSISPERFVWWSKHKEMNQVLKAIVQDFKKSRGGDRVSSGKA